MELSEMVPENQQMPNGWPLGLKNLTTRLSVESSQTAVVPVPASRPSSIHVQSSSFSSFCSSNLDTESTASFSADHSVTLGRLIGINPMTRGSLHFTNTTQLNRDEREQELDDIVSANDEKEMCRGICVPLLQNIIMVKRSKSRVSSRH